MNTFTIQKFINIWNIIVSKYGKVNKYIHISKIRIVLWWKIKIHSLLVSGAFKVRVMKRYKIYYGFTLSFSMYSYLHYYMYYVLIFTLYSQVQRNIRWSLSDKAIEYVFFLFISYTLIAVHNWCKSVVFVFFHHKKHRIEIRKSKKIYIKDSYFPVVKNKNTFFTGKYSF